MCTKSYMSGLFDQTYDDQMVKTTEFDWGDHRLRVALREKIPFVPCHVIPQWLPPNGSFKNVNADLTILQSKEVMLPEHSALTVLNVKQVQS